jgi:hypothetical protein
MEDRRIDKELQRREPKQRKKANPDARFLPGRSEISGKVGRFLER